MTEAELEILDVLRRRGGEMNLSDLQQVFPTEPVRAMLKRLEKQGAIAFHYSPLTEESKICLTLF